MHHLISAALLAMIATEAASQAPTPVGPLERGENVRVWSERQKLDGRYGWIEDVLGSTLVLKVAAPAHLETDELYTRLALDTVDVDTIEVNIQGRWWRANFGTEPFAPVDARAHVANTLERVPPYTRIRLWSREQHLSGAHAVLVDQRPDTIEVHLGTPGEFAAVTAMPVRAIDRLAIPARGWTNGTGVGRGIAVGALFGAAYSWIDAPCHGTRDPTNSASSPNCSPIPSTLPVNVLICGAIGAATGLTVAWWTRHRWSNVALPH